MSTAENTSATPKTHDIQKQKHKKSESMEGLQKLLSSGGYGGLKPISLKGRISVNLTQSSFFSKSTVASTKDPRPETQSTILRSRGTSTRFFTPKAHQYEPITPIDQSSIFTGTKTSHFDPSTLKRNVQFLRDAKQRVQNKPKFRSVESLKSQAQTTEILSTTASQKDETNKKPRFVSSVRSLRSNKSPKHISINESSIVDTEHTEEANNPAEKELNAVVDSLKHKVDNSVSSFDKVKSFPKANQDSKTTIDSYQSQVERLRKDHSAFIKNNFRGMNYDRLKTFEKFAFTNIEREEYKDIVPILEDLRTYKERGGTMFVTDLWSKHHQKEVLLQSEFLQEKRRLEKFAFYKAMQKVRNKKSEMQFLVINNKNERVLKDVIFRNHQKEDFLANQNNQLIEELEMKEKIREPSNRFNLPLKNTLSVDQTKTRNLFLKIYQLEDENKEDFRMLKKKYQDQRAWINKMRGHKTITNKDDDKLDDLKRLKFLID